MGSVPNVGLMARKAEEYGSHDKTFEVAASGEMRVVSSSGDIVMSHAVQQGDIWRMCTTKDAAISNWVDLAVQRGEATGAAVVFWLDADRPHDAEVITKVDDGLAALRAEGRSVDELGIRVMAPTDACRFSLERIRRGSDTISVTGNVLRDYNTDLFPILELGTSAKMLSVVPLMAGGGLFETGAGGSAPKHVQQFEAENHLRWDSLGEFLALAVSLEPPGRGSPATPLLNCLRTPSMRPTARGSPKGELPAVRSHEPDNRASHFHLAKHWAAEMARQDTDPALAVRFASLAAALADSEDTIIAELIDCQGTPMDIGGYYLPDPSLAESAMRPSATFNQILDDFRSATQA